MMRAVALVVALSLAGCGGAQFTRGDCERSAQTVGNLSGFARALCGLAGTNREKCETAMQVASGALTTYRASCGFLPKLEDVER